jgi:acyl carrier protein
MEFEKIQKIIAQTLGIDQSEVTPDKTFENDLGADSLDRVEIIMLLEDAMGLEIPDDAAENIVTVQDAFEAIKAVRS